VPPAYVVRLADATVLTVMAPSAASAPIPCATICARLARTRGQPSLHESGPGFRTVSAASWRRVPQQDGAVYAAACDCLAVRGEHDAIDPTLMASKGGNLAASRHVP